MPIVLFACLATASPAWGLGLPADAPPAAVRRYERGIALYGEGRFADAAVEFRVGLALYPESDQLLFDYARALERSGDLKAAVTTYDQYLRRFPAMANAEEVRRTVASLRAVVAQRRPEVRLTSVPVGAAVYVDGAATSAGQTPVALRLPAGTHVIRLVMPPRADTTRSVDVPAEGVTVAVELTALPVETEAAPTAVAAPAAAPGAAPVADWRTYAGYGGLIGGSVGVALGTVFLFQALDTADAAGRLTQNDRARHEELGRDLDAQNTRMGVSFAVGGLLVAGGVALLLWGHADTPPAAALGIRSSSLEVRF